jgi:hypothetical protein
MKYIIWKPYWNNEREEKWLNEMAAKGLALHSYSWLRYVFEETPPGEYIYRLELLKYKPTHPESMQYIKFVEETGAECVVTYWRWAYFRKKAADGTFELYTDFTSRIAHHKRLRTFWYGFAFIELVALIMNLTAGLIPLVSSMNLILAGVLGILFALFVILIASQTRRIKALKREQKINEG